MNALLFVYGTLLSAATGDLGRAQRLRLAHEARAFGAATAAGRLFDLGGYPGLVMATGGGGVHGEALLLLDPARSLAWLDEYEGVTGAARDEYVRLLTPIRLADGTHRDAWAYACLAVPAAPLIRSGNWLLTGG